MLLVASERSTGTVAPPPPPWRASRRPRHSLTSAAKEVDFFFGFTSRRVVRLRGTALDSFLERMAGEEGAKPSSDKAKKFDTSFKKAVGGSLKLKGVEFKGYRSLQAAACASVWQPPRCCCASSSSLLPCSAPESCDCAQQEGDCDKEGGGQGGHGQPRGGGRRAQDARRRQENQQRDSVWSRRWCHVV